MSNVLSVIIPAHNEEGCIEETVLAFYEKLKTESIPHELLIVNDHSSDNTPKILEDLKNKIPTLRWVSNSGPGGFGNALKYGIDQHQGDIVCFIMADKSDDPSDVVKFYRKILEGSDCVFGSRFSPGGKTYDYPGFKLVLNRFFNNIIRLAFQLSYNDITNAFKMYRSDVLNGLRPILSHHFNITVELPLKAIIRGYTYEVIPNSWTNRKAGESKLKIKEMGSRYFFILFYCLLEKWLVAGDYAKKPKKLKSLQSKSQ
jgi:dolichol-phosphate mannosyltransferase